MSGNSQKIRPVVIAGNWKMYKTIEEAGAFVETVAPVAAKSQAAVYLAVPFTALHTTSEKAKELGGSVTIGAQNMNDASEGAFTGEIAGKMLKDAGAQFVLLGHSERRHIFGETSAYINRKVKRALADGLQPIVCIGETLEEREAGKVEETLKAQLLGSLDGIAEQEMEKALLAYEPVWAIGTGKVAHPDDAESAHAYCREVLSELYGKTLSEKISILYGGSVKPENAAALLAQPSVDGLLIGGASLSAETFCDIIGTS